MGCRTTSVLIEHIDERMQQLDEQLAAELLHLKPVLPKALALSFAREVQGLSRWCPNTELRDDALMLAQLSEALPDAPARQQPGLLQAFFSVQLRVNDAARTRLRQLLRKLLEQTVSALAALPGNSLAAQEKLLAPLQHLQQFLAVAESRNPVIAETAGNRPSLDMPARLKLVAADWYAATSEQGLAQELLQKQLEQLLLNIARRCLQSTWTMAAYVDSTLRQLCTRALGLSEFCLDQHCKNSLHELSQTIVLRHVRQQPPETDALQAMLHALMSLALGKVAVCKHTPLPCSAQQLSLDDSTARLVAAELTAYADSLKQALAATGSSDIAPGLAAQTNEGFKRPGLVNETMLLVSYKLTWVLQTCGSRQLADLNLCLYQLYLQCWSLRMPLPARLLRVAETFRKLLLVQVKRALSDSELALVPPLMNRVLDCWPEPVEDAALMIPVGLAGGHIPGALPLGQLQQYLSSAFPVLLSVTASNFEARDFLHKNFLNVQNELRLLEQGSAAFKLAAMEKFSTLMLDVYLLLDLFKAGYLPNLPLPGALLWQVHQHLTGMLDRAAAWLEPVEDPALAGALADWLAQADAAIAAERNRQCRIESVPALVLALTAFVRQMGALLGSSVRLKVLAADELPGCLYQMLASALSELLRWLLLQPEAAMETRRELHKPLAVNIQVIVKARGSQCCQVELNDDSCASLPSQKQLYRLRKKAGFAVQNLKSALLAGQGRQLCFSVHAPE